MHQKKFKTEILPLKNKLYSYACSLLQNRDVAYDVVQDVMLKMWEDRDRWHLYRSIEAWCMRLTRNRSLDELKRSANKSEHIELHIDNWVVSNTPDRQQETRDQMQQLDLIMLAMSPAQREVIHLRDVMGYSYQEIGEMMELSVGQVKTNLHRGRKKVKQELEAINAYGIG